MKVIHDINVTEFLYYVVLIFLILCCINLFIDLGKSQFNLSDSINRSGEAQLPVEWISCTLDIVFGYSV